MPYKSEEAQREAARLRMQRMRARGVTLGVTSSQGVTDPSISEGVTLESGVTQGVTGELTGPWLTVAEKINTPCPGMPNLERLQRISGSLGKYTDDVWYGLGGLTMGDIGKVIGTLPAMTPK